MPKYDVHTVRNFCFNFDLKMCGNVHPVYRPITKPADVLNENTLIKFCKLL